KTARSDAKEHHSSHRLHRCKKADISCNKHRPYPQTPPPAQTSAKFATNLTQSAIIPLMTIWNFVKMHGAGNDFVVLDGVRQNIDLTPERARALADRHFGIG